MVAIMGASGSGKSTLLHIIGGVDKPTDGKYMFDDIEVSGLSDPKLGDFRKKNVSFVFQQYALMEELYRGPPNVLCYLVETKGWPSKNIINSINIP